MEILRLIYLISDALEPEKFSRILSPHDARYELSRGYLFGGTAGMSICSRRHITRNTQSGIGVSSYQEDTQMKRAVFDDINQGSRLAIGNSFGAWSSAKHVFYIDADGKLQRYPGSHLPALYPVAHVIERYEDMVHRYGQRPKPTVLPPRQNITRRPPLQQAIATAAATVTATLQAMRPMTKAERWQERQYLIGRGKRSIYPDARIAAQRLADNNIAVEKAKLAENIYKTTGPLQTVPNVPEGWKDISNNEASLNKMGLSSKMLYDDDLSPDFLARVYQPDEEIFGKAMNPTVVFRGSRAPEFPGLKDAAMALAKGDTPDIKNFADWSNNLTQGGGMHSEYYKRAVEIDDSISKYPDVDIAGHSLGGGMASAASIASGNPAWTFNAAGLHKNTVEMYSGSRLGDTSNIHAYRVENELLTTIQEVNLPADYRLVKGNLFALAAKEAVSVNTPNAAGITYALPGGAGSLLDKHGIDQAINCIEEQKDDDIATIKGRI
ncbi:lipase family protein [Serratia ficaria]